MTAGDPIEITVELKAAVQVEPDHERNVLAVTVAAAPGVRVLVDRQDERP